MRSLLYLGAVLFTFLFTLGLSNAEFDPCLYAPEDRVIPMLELEFQGDWNIVQTIGSAVKELVVGADSGPTVSCPTLRFSPQGNVKEITTVSGQVDGNVVEQTILSSFVNNFFFGTYGENETSIVYQVIGTDYDDWAVMAVCFPETREGGVWVMTRDGGRLNEKKMSKALENVGASCSDLVDTQSC